MERLSLLGVEGREEPGKGRGVLWEGRLIYNHLYTADAGVQRFVPILLEDGAPVSAGCGGPRGAWQGPRCSVGGQAHLQPSIHGRCRCSKICPDPIRRWSACLCWVWRAERSLARAAVFCGRAGSFTTIYTRPMPVFKDLSRSY